MDGETLPLFESQDTPKVTEEQIVTPLNQVLESVTPGNKPITAKDPPKPLTQSLNELFPEQAYDEKDIQKAKETLGALTKKLSPDELKDTITEMQFLADSWLDDFERKIFGGLTLNELLHEKGGQ